MMNMAAQINVLSSSLGTCRLPVSHNHSSPPPYYFRTPTSGSNFRIKAKLGESSTDQGEPKKGQRKFITREEEPQQYWQTAGEREGENPMKTPLPYIIIFGMSTPFVILAIAFLNGWIKAPIR